MTVYETPVRVQVDPTPGDPTRVRLTLSAHDGECGMFEDVPVAWLRDQLGVSAEIERLRAERDRQLPAALEAGEALVERAVDEAVAETEARMIARAEAAEAERYAAVAEIGRLRGFRAESERQFQHAVDRYCEEMSRAEAAEAERDAAVARADTLAAQVEAGRTWARNATNHGVLTGGLLAALDGGGEPHCPTCGGTKDDRRPAEGLAHCPESFHFRPTRGPIGGGE